MKNKNNEYSDFYKNNKLFFREEYANGKLRAVREYSNGFHYLTIINNSKALLKVKIVKNKWVSAEIPNTEHKFNSMQDFYGFILSKKVKKGDIIFSEFRDKGLPYLPGGGLDNIVASLDDDIKKIAFIHTTHLRTPYRDVQQINGEFTKLFDLKDKFYKFIVLTNEQKEDINKTNSVENIVVIPHSFSSKKVENISRNLNDIIVITRLAEKKNFDLVLEIQKVIQARNLDFQMNVYGKVATEKGYEVVQKKIMDENLSINIKGSINNIENEIARSCCTLVTSIAEDRLCVYMKV